MKSGKAATIHDPRIYFLYAASNFLLCYYTWYP